MGSCHRGGPEGVFLSSGYGIHTFTCLDHFKVQCSAVTVDVASTKSTLCRPDSESDSPLGETGRRTATQASLRIQIRIDDVFRTNTRDSRHVHKSFDI